MNFDAIIIGAGQAGSPLSFGLADLGWNVALVEKSYLGGTCINTGCTPTKTMVASAEVAYYARNAGRWGVRAGAVSMDLPAVLARKNHVVGDSRSGLEKDVQQRKTLRLFRGQARFVDAHSIEVNGETLSSGKIFINTGMRPAIPPVEGLATVGYLDNASIMELTEVPERLLVLGAGYTGLEFAQMFARFGSRVTIVSRGEQILPHEDPEIAAELRRILEAEGLLFAMGAETKRVERQGKEILLTVETPQGAQTFSGSQLLLATGRKPNTGDLGLEKAGVETDRGGFIRVNGRLETNVPGIWALGDVKGGPAFTHISFNDYQIVWANLIEGQNRSIENRYVPYSVFTDPQLGRVGLTEKEARAKGYRLKLATVPMSRVARAIEIDETAGLMKLVVDAASDRILGAAILASEGGETVQIFGFAMVAGIPYTKFKDFVYIHPTLAEGFYFLIDAVKPVE